MKKKKGINDPGMKLFEDGRFFLGRVKFDLIRVLTVASFPVTTNTQASKMTDISGVHSYMAHAKLLTLHLLRKYKCDISHNMTFDLMLRKKPIVRYSLLYHYTTLTKNIAVGKQ